VEKSHLLGKTIGHTHYIHEDIQNNLSFYSV